MLDPTQYFQCPRRIAASVKSLTGIKDVTTKDAKLIRLVWKALDRDSLLYVYPAASDLLAGDLNYTRTMLQKDCINKILGTCGVESLGDLKSTGAEVKYCNPGDPYALTVMFSGDRMWVQEPAYLVERGLVVEFQQP
jgi:hypothetical protein